MQAFLHGLTLSFGLILPLGVQNLFIFNQGATQKNLLRALPAVLTAAVCDTLLILLAVFGVSILVLNFSAIRLLLIIFGAAFLLYMGWLTWNEASGIRQTGMVGNFSPGRQITFAITVSLLNPHAILDTIGVIGTSSANYEGQEKILFTAACILVSWIWFLVLATMGRTLGNQSWFEAINILINKFSAIFMWGSAVYMLYSVM